MSARSPRTVARALWSVSLAEFVAGVVLLVLNRSLYVLGEVAVIAATFLTGIVYTSVGGLIASRVPRNPIGWLLSGIGVAFGFAVFAEQYALRGLVSAPGSLPGVHPVASIGNATPIASVASLLLVVLLFPDGHPPSRRWRPVLWVAVAVDVVGSIGFLLQKVLVTGVTNSLQDQHVAFPSTLGVFSEHGPSSFVLGVAGFLGLATALATIVSVFVRRRRGSRELRQQLAWLGYVGVIAIAAFAAALINADRIQALSNAIWFVMLIDIVLGIPVACAIAILRYRLYELDIVVKKTVVFAILAAFVTAVFVAVVVGIGALVTGAGNSVVTFIATAIVAIAFQPLRTRARRLADRVVYGKRATPYEVLSEFSDRMATSYSTEEVLPRMAQILGEGLGARRAGVWLRVGSELRLLATWPSVNGEEATVTQPIAAVEAGPLPGSDRTFPVRHQDELLGALTVAMPPAEPITPTKEKLAADLASQAGLVLRNVRLIEELRASRQRLVAAQDQERRRIERNLHDGAQQQLVALAVKLGLARTLNQKDPDRADQMLEGLQSDAQAALETLRDLARGIYPPLLADKGLAAALTAQANKASVPVEVETDGVGRYPQDAEAAVYFCCLEALQNIAKYAGASRVRVRLGADDGHLTFEVTDDGKGFDPKHMVAGAGLQNMADRLAALGGTLQVRSQPGKGTTVSGRLPVRGLQPAT